MTPTIEITGVRIRRALAPVRRVLNTRVGRFTKGPFLLIDLELKGGGYGRAKQRDPKLVTRDRERGYVVRRAR